MSDSQRELYIDCIRKQLEEVDMLSSIYCNPGEMHIFDASVISDFNEFLRDPTVDSSIALKAHLDYTITLKLPLGKTKEKLEIRIELPHLYPMLENASVITYSPLLSKSKEVQFRAQIEEYIDSLEKQETYVFQVLSWIQDNIDDVIKCAGSEFGKSKEKVDLAEEVVEVERLWIYSHHIKSKIKRQSILRESRLLDLSGFCRPGRPGIICVEGLRAHTEQFWQVIKSLHWKKITLCKSEVTQKQRGKIAEWRRFQGFTEQLFCDDKNQTMDTEAVINMGDFIKFLESHNSGYMKKELFGLA